MGWHERACDSSVEGEGGLERMSEWRRGGKGKGEVSLSENRNRKGKGSAEEEKGQ